MIKGSDILKVLTLLSLKSPLIHTHSAPPLLVLPSFLPRPLLCDDIYVLMETRCCSVVVEEVAREKNQACGCLLFH